MLSTHLDPVVVVGSTRTKHGHETAFLKADVAKQTRAKDRSQLDVASTCHEKAIPGEKGAGREQRQLLRRDSTGCAGLVLLSSQEAAMCV